MKIYQRFLYNPYSEDEPWCPELSAESAIGLHWGGIEHLLSVLEAQGGYGGDDPSAAENLMVMVRHIRTEIAKGNGSTIAASFAADEWGTAETLHNLVC